MFWLYKVTGPRTRRYLCPLPDLSYDIVYKACEPYFEPGKSYVVALDLLRVLDGNDGATRFGVTFVVDNHNGICGRCNEPAVFRKTALVCPMCMEYIGGI